VYDPAKWAVVFKYTSVNVPLGVTVKFKNHVSRAPVVWLVSGNVSVAGTVDVSGADGGPLGTLAEPGPGGFRGGKGGDISSPHGSGFGAGGGAFYSGDFAFGGSYGGLGSFNGVITSAGIYGNDRIIPLVGGSGAAGGGYSGGVCTRSGGAGGGAILVAANGTVAVGGAIIANGGDGTGCTSYSEADGSGGGIRIVADQIQGLGSLQAASGLYNTGGAGRISLEGNSVTLEETSPQSKSAAPCASPGGPGCVAQIWPDDLIPAPPEVRIARIDGSIVTSDPHSQFSFPHHDVRIANPNPVTIKIDSRGVPPSGWTVKVRVTAREGGYVESAPATPDGASTDNPGWDRWTTTLAIPNSFSAIQARASTP